MPVCKYVDWNGSAVILVARRSAGVAPEVNLRNSFCAGHETCKWQSTLVLIPVQTSPEIQNRVSVAQKKDQKILKWKINEVYLLTNLDREFLLRRNIYFVKWRQLKYTTESRLMKKTVNYVLHYCINYSFCVSIILIRTVLNMNPISYTKYLIHLTYFRVPAAPRLVA